MMFAHGFGCDQSMWRLVAPAFENSFRVVCFDYIGAGNSDLSVYDEQKYNSLHGYAEDVVALAHDLGIQDGVFVGHSVSAMIGVLAAKHHPELFSDLVLVAPSPRYIDDGNYVGGSSAAQIQELLDFLDRDHLAWSRALAPVIIGNLDRPEHDRPCLSSLDDPLHGGGRHRRSLAAGRARTAQCQSSRQGQAAFRTTLVGEVGNR